MSEVVSYTDMHRQRRSQAATLSMRLTGVTVPHTVSSPTGQHAWSDVPSLMQVYPISQQPPPQQVPMVQHPPVRQVNVVREHVCNGPTLTGLNWP